MRASWGAIGIDIGSRRVKAAQGRVVGGVWRVEHALVLPRSRPGVPWDDGEARRLSAVLDRRGFVGRRVVVAAPHDLVLTGDLELPPRSSGAPLDQLARMELARTHRCEPDAIELAYWDVPRPARGGDTSPVLAVACRHSDTTALLDAFDGAGLDVERLDVASVAVVRAVRPLLGSGPTLLVDIGWSAARIAAVVGGVVVLDRAVDGAGVAAFVSRLGDRLGVEASVAEEVAAAGVLGASEAGRRGSVRQVQGAFDEFIATIAHDVEASMGYLRHRFPGGESAMILFCGGGAMLPGVSESLGGVLGTGGEPARAGLSAPLGPGAIALGQDTSLGVAIGLAAGGEGSA